MLAKGHGLLREGRAHDSTGRYTGWRVGHGVCACGLISPTFVSTKVRQRWHVIHKQEVASATSGEVFHG